MKEVDKVSVVIPMFNSSEFILETLDSVIAQTYSNWECIIVDDGSTDQSYEIVNDYIGEDKRFQLLKRGVECKGVSTCRNIGINQARGEWIIFLDSDDLLLSTCLEKRVDFYRSNRQLDFIVFQMETFGLNRQLMTKFSRDYLKSYLSFDFKWAITCPIWKTIFLKQIEGFNENLSVFEDPELHARAILKGANYLVFPQLSPDCFYRIRERNLNDKSEAYFRRIKSYKCFVESLIGLQIDYKPTLFKNCFYSFHMNLIYPLNNVEIDLIRDNLIFCRNKKILGRILSQLITSIVDMLKEGVEQHKQKRIIYAVALFLQPNRFLSDYFLSKFNLLRKFH